MRELCSSIVRSYMQPHESISIMAYSEDHSSLVIGYYKKRPRKPSWEVFLKIKRYGKGLTQRVSMEDGGSG